MTALSTRSQPVLAQPIGDPELLASLDEERRRRVLGTVLVAGAVFMTVTGAIFVILVGELTWSTAVTAACDLTLVAAWFLRRRHLRTASTVTLGMLAVAFPITMLQWGGLRSPVLIVAPLIPVLVTSFAGARGARWMGALLVVGISGVWVASRLDLLPRSLLSAAATEAMALAYALGGIAIGAYLAHATERERKGLEANLDAQSRALYETSVHDALTQLYNRRYLSHRLDEELAFASRHDTGLGVVILDVDHFKRINDTHGHGGGDEVLTALGAILHNAVRREDVVARYGGEEFAILLRGLDLASVAIAAERVRSAVEAHAFLIGGQRVPVTVSAGCASLACCGDIKTAGHLLAVADARLYRAKRSGRNRVALGD